MRGLDTNVKRIRRKVFKEIARVGFESETETLVADIEAIPYHIVPQGSKTVWNDSSLVSDKARESPHNRSPRPVP